MTTLELFQLPARLEREIRMDTERIQHYRDAAVRCTSNPEFSSAQGNFGHSRVADAAEKIADAEAGLEKKKAALQECTIRLVDLIYSFSGELTAKVLYKRFIEYKYCSDIAMELNYTDSYIRRIIKAGLKEANTYIKANCPEYLTEEVTLH